MNTDFEHAIQHAVNYHGVDARLCLPDYVIARYLVRCLQSFEEAALQNNGFREEAYKNAEVIQAVDDSRP